ncbi:hypothetical protein ACA29_15965 [Lederbergia galactosidilytica]|uniref:DUF4367 domain-containing protein n=1 Tax=Lederbergia galactosidilytica TaxID=217031 RepID=A0A0Q9XSP0_9BACI|nr:hypothetical protein ACA29_15965 [Lederbergia galactosidilytica]
MPLDFTHSFGRFNKENENLEIEYLSEKQHFNYIINVIPSKNETELLSDIDSQVFLKDGTQANYLTSGKDGKSLITFMFKKNNWTYILSIEERLLDNPLSTMMEIANSF